MSRARVLQSVRLIAANGFGLGEGGEFNHKSLIEK